MTKAWVPTKLNARLTRAMGLVGSVARDKTLVFRTDVFTNRQGGYPRYRIPALVQLDDLASGHLLAFAEGRSGLGDAGKIDLVYRESFDGGRSWGSGPVTVLSTASDLGDPALIGGTLGNPVPIYLAETQRLLVLACSNGKDATESKINAGTVSPAATRRVWLFSGTVKESGVVWDGAARELTAEVKRPGWTWVATGPANGVVLANGTIAVPCNHAGGSPDTGDRSHLMFSPDVGATWTILDGFAPEGSREGAMAQVSSGELLLNSRDNNGKPRPMMVFAGAPPTPSLVSSFLPVGLKEPPEGCEGALAALPAVAEKPDSVPPGAVFFSKVNSAARRQHLTIFRSDDLGHSWPRSFLVEKGASGYSSLLFLGGGSDGGGDVATAWCWLLHVWQVWLRGGDGKDGGAAAPADVDDKEAGEVPSRAMEDGLGVLFESGGAFWWSPLVEWIGYLIESPLWFAQRISFARVSLGPASPLVIPS